ncbi:Poly(rC)-binding protein 4 [Tetrabaena socialis]|uniref:Poly(RC)-binding protein 4 n=1 Tax=Tetrabaena socialis TaxID=47790 RepID=A0A2J7ZTU3_9CHLO|nr:Poly(rC)-binding protein 4 [Tetrabaena socialis]|eukprot:PNH03689.1 Poly(rC)-binding protein 4 [Tetrabaena socialis]
MSEAEADSQLGPVEVPDIDKYVAGSSSGDLPTGTQQVVAKLLVSNSIAGSVIGKAGANIEQLQRSSGARVQLSRAGEFYPGTSDRVLLLSGSLHAVLTAIFLILEKISRDLNAASASPNAAKRIIKKYEEPGQAQVKLALSRRLCGLLIGHKGQTVRDFIVDSGSTIRVQSLNELTPSDPERTITVSGARDQVLRAVALILNTLSMHEGYASYMETTLQLATNQGVVLPPRASSSKNVLATVRTQLTLYLPDDDVGAILGKKGQNLVEVQQSSRVTIKISDRSKMDPTTNEREVSISGLYSSVKLAEAMIAEKLAVARSQARNREGGDRGDDA